MSEGYFVDGSAIRLEVLRKLVHKCLGSDVVIEPSSYNGVHGYVLSATKPQTLESLKDLVRRSGAISLGHCQEKSNAVVLSELVRNNGFTQERGDHYVDKFRTPSINRRISSDNFHRPANKTYPSESFPISHIRMPFRSFVGPSHQTTPRYDTIIWNSIVLVTFFSMLCLAVRYPTKSMRIAFVSTSGFVFIALLVSVAMDLVAQGDRTYIRNLGNTALTVLLTIPLMTTLYVFIWYPELDRKLVGVSQDIVGEARFPSVTLFQRLDWSAQAHILPANYSKCFLGWLDPTDTTPMCKGLPQIALVSGQSCDCSEGWSSPVVEDFILHDIAYRYLSFTPSTSLITSRPTYMMTLQIFFNYNASFSLKTTSQEQGPSLLMAIHDPTLGLMEALEGDYSRMFLMSANGDSSINLGLQYWKAMGRTPAYDYSMTLYLICACDKVQFLYSIALGISTVPNLNLVCNTASQDSYPCHTTLFLQIPTLSRTIMTESWAMGWLDVAGSVGGWFSFVQTLSWLLSGQAGAT